VHLIGVIIRIYHDTLSSECQIPCISLLYRGCDTFQGNMWGPINKTSTSKPIHYVWRRFPEFWGCTVSPSDTVCNIYTRSEITDRCLGSSSDVSRNCDCCLDNPDLRRGRCRYVSIAGRISASCCRMCIIWHRSAATDSDSNICRSLQQCNGWECSITSSDFGYCVPACYLAPCSYPEPYEPWLYDV